MNHEPRSWASKPSPAARPAILECDTRHVRMPSVLQLVEGEMFTGRIELRPGGEILVRDGAVVGGHSDEGLDGADAVRELFLVGEGTCRVVLDPSVEGAPIGSTIGFIMDGCKLVDEWTELAGERIVRAPRPPAPAPAVEATLSRLGPLLDRMARGATLAGAVAETRAHRVEVVPLVTKLLEAGAVVLPQGEEHHLPLSVPAPEAATPEPLPVAELHVPDDMDELLTQARGFIRANRLDEAEHFLRVALQRYPNDRVLAQNMRHLLLRRMPNANAR